jgi:hypothetical protein
MFLLDLKMIGEKTLYFGPLFRSYLEEAGQQVILTESQ